MENKENNAPPWHTKNNLDAGRSEIKAIRTDNKSSLDTKEIKPLFIHPDGYSKNNDLLEDVNVLTTENKLKDQATHVKSQLEKNHETIETFGKDIDDSRADFNTKTENIEKSKLEDIKNNNAQRRRNISTSSSESSFDALDTSTDFTSTDSEDYEWDEKKTHAGKVLTKFTNQLKTGEFVQKSSTIGSRLLQMGAIYSALKDPVNDFAHVEQKYRDKMKKQIIDADIDTVQKLQKSDQKFEKEYEEKLEELEVDYSGDFEKDMDKLYNDLDELDDAFMKNRAKQTKELLSKLQAARDKRFNKIRDDKNKKLIKTGNTKSASEKLERSVSSLQRELYAKQSELEDQKRETQEMQEFNAFSILNDLLSNEEKTVHSEALQALKQNIDDSEEAKNRVRNVQLDKLKRRMKNRKKQPSILTETSIRGVQNTTSHEENDYFQEKNEKNILNKINHAAEKLTNAKQLEVVKEFVDKNGLSEKLIEEFSQALGEHDSNVALKRQLQRSALAKRRAALNAAHLRELDQQNQKNLNALNAAQNHMNTDAVLEMGVQEIYEITGDSELNAVVSSKKENLNAEYDEKIKELDRESEEVLKSFDEKQDASFRKKLEKYDSRQQAGELLEKHAALREKVVENLDRAKLQQRLNFQDKMNARRQRALKMMELEKDRKIAAETLEATQNALKNNFENGFIADKAKVTDMVSKGPVTPEIIKEILTMRQKKEIEAVWKLLPLIRQNLITKLQSKVLSSL